MSTRGESVRKRARVYMCTGNPGISVESLSLSRSLSLSFSLRSLRNQNYPGIVSESVSRLFVKLYFQIFRDSFRSGAMRIGSTL